MRSIVECDGPEFVVPAEPGEARLRGSTAVVSPSADARALIIDRRAVMGTEMCRALARIGLAVDVVGEETSPAFRSRYCSGRFVIRSGAAGERLAKTLAEIVGRVHYDAIFVCNEEILECILDLPKGNDWSGLPLAPPASLRMALSKNAMTQLADKAGIATPRTIVPSGAGELPAIGRELGFPLIVKGDRGEAGKHVRLVLQQQELAAAYLDIAALERTFGTEPAVQEYIRGVGFSVGGLFEHGRPLRVCGHRKLVAVPPRVCGYRRLVPDPPLGGLTVKGVTDRPHGLLETAFRIFAELEYTGLGHVDLIRDMRGRFIFLEINPRAWGTIAIADYAGVDLFSAYLALARGQRVQPNLSFREGIRFHRIIREGRMIRERPSRILGFLRDCFDPAVHSDFEWSDPGPHLAALATHGLGLFRGAQRSADAGQPS